MRDLLRRIHLTIGALLCVPLGVLGLTGSVLVFEDDLRAMFEPPPVAHASGAARPLAEIVEAARGAAPRGTAPNYLAPAQRYGDSAQVRFSDPKRGPGPGGLLVFVDPVSGAVLGTQQGSDGLIRQISSLHSNLLLRDFGGRSVIGWLGVAMLMLGCTGPFLWWPKRQQWRSVFRVRWNAGPYAVLRDLHGIVGICGVIVLLAVSFSGVYLAFPQTVGGTIASILPARDLRGGGSEVRVTPIEGRMPLDIDAAAALARSAAPDATLRSIFLPLRKDQPYRVNLARGEAEQGVPLVSVFVDPWAGRVVELRDPQTYSAGERIIGWQRALHAGAGFGWPWKIVVFLSGFLPPLFAGSGVAMWLLKRRARLQRKAAGEPRQTSTQQGKIAERQQS